MSVSPSYHETPVLENKSERYLNCLIKTFYLPVEVKKEQYSFRHVAKFIYERENVLIFNNCAIC